MQASFAEMPAWDRVRTVVLDMDGTLLDLHFDDQVWNHALPRHYAKRSRVSLDAASARVKEKLDGARGTLAWYCLDHWTREFGVNIAALERELADFIRVRPGARAFLRALKKAGYTTMLATNAHPDSLKRKLAKTGIDRYFDTVVSAHDLGSPKENPAFWHAFAGTIGLDSATALLIDDNHGVLEAARSFGIRHLYGIRQPNSAGAPISSDEFFCIDSFASIAPGATEAPRG